MSSAKKDFISRIRSLNKSISIEAVTSRSLSESEHNDIAKLLRNGLAVVSFAALEDFIKNRSSEAMDEIGKSSVLFIDLPDRLQQAATYEAIGALNYQLSVRDKSEKISYVQNHAMKIASTATTNYEITPHAFAYGQANVNAENIKQILLCFNVADPWKQMSLIASRLNLTALPLVESYRNAATRRHRAAHVASADTPQGDISQFVKEAFAIAIGFDSLLSKSLSRIKAYDKNYLSGVSQVGSGDVKFRIVKYTGNRWKEIIESSNRAFRTSTDHDQLVLKAKMRAVAAKQIYVEFDSTGLVKSWESN